MNESVSGQKMLKITPYEHTKRIRSVLSSTSKSDWQKEKKRKISNLLQKYVGKDRQGVIGVNARKLNRDCLHLNNARDGKMEHNFNSLILKKG